MEIRCPQCQGNIFVDGDHSPDEIRCGECGSTFVRSAKTVSFLPSGAEHEITYVPAIPHTTSDGLPALDDYDVIDEIIAPDVIEHEEFAGFEPGREGVKQGFQVFHAAFPDLHVDIQDVLADGDKVIARMHWTGTHQGEFMGMPATGKQVAFNVIDIFRFDEGRMVEHWGVSDSLAMMTQLGAIPEPGGSNN